MGDEESSLFDCAMSVVPAMCTSAVRRQHTLAWIQNVTIHGIKKLWEPMQNRAMRPSEISAHQDSAKHLLRNLCKCLSVLNSSQEVPADPLDPIATSDLVFAHSNRQILLMRLFRGSDDCSSLPAVSLLPLLEAAVSIAQDLSPDVATAALSTAACCRQAMSQVDDLPACASQALLLGQAIAAAHGGASVASGSKRHVASLLSDSTGASHGAPISSATSSLSTPSVRAAARAAPAAACLCVLGALDGRLGQLAAQVRGGGDTVQVHELYSTVITACMAVAVAVGRLTSLASWVAAVASGEASRGALPRLPVAAAGKPPKASVFAKLIAPHAFSPSLFVVLGLGGSSHQRMAAAYVAAHAARGGSGADRGGLQWYEHLALLASLSSAALPTLAAPLVHCCVALLQQRPRPSAVVLGRPGGRRGVGASELVQAADSTWWGYTAPRGWDTLLTLPPFPPAVAARPAAGAWTAPWVAAFAPALGVSRRAAMFGSTAAWGAQVDTVSGNGGADALLSSLAAADAAARSPQGRLALLSADESMRSSLASQAVAAPSGATYPTLQSYLDSVSTAVPPGCFPAAKSVPGEGCGLSPFLGSSHTAEMHPWVASSQAGSIALVRVLQHSPGCVPSFLREVLGGLTAAAGGSIWLSDALGVLHELCRTRPVQMLGGESVSSTISGVAAGAVDVSLSQSMRHSSTGTVAGGGATHHAAQVTEALCDIVDASMYAPPSSCGAVLLALSPLLELAAREAASAAGGARGGDLGHAKQLHRHVMLALRKAGVHRGVRLRVNAVQGVLACVRAAVAVAQEGARSDASSASQDFESSQAASELVPVWLGSLLLDCVTLLRRACTQQVHVRSAVLEGVAALSADIAARCRLLRSAGEESSANRQELAVLLYTLAQLDMVLSWRLQAAAPLWRAWWQPREAATVLGLEGAVDVSPLPLDVHAAIALGSVVCEPLPDLLRAASAVAAALAAGVQAARAVGLIAPQMVSEGVGSLVQAADMQRAAPAAAASSSGGGRKRRREVQGGSWAWGEEAVLRGVGVAAAACTPEAIVALAAQVVHCDTDKWRCLTVPAAGAAGRSQRLEQCAMAELLGACAAALLDGIAQALAPYGSQGVMSQPVLVRLQGDLLQLLCRAEECSCQWAQLGGKRGGGVAREDSSEGGSVATPATAPAGSVATAATAATVSGGGAAAGLGSLPALARLPAPATWLWLTNSSGMCQESEHYVACLRSAALSSALWLHAQGRAAAKPAGGLAVAGLAGSPLLDCAAWELQNAALPLLQASPRVVFTGSEWRPPAASCSVRPLTQWVVAALAPQLTKAAAACGPLPHEALHSDSVWKASTLSAAVLSGDRMAALLRAADSAGMNSSGCAGHAAAVRAVAAAAATAAVHSNGALGITAAERSLGYKRARSAAVHASLSQDSDSSHSDQLALDWPTETPGATMQRAFLDVQDRQSVLVPTALCWLRGAAGCGTAGNTLDAQLGRLGDAAQGMASQTQSQAAEQSHESSMLMGTQAQAAPQRPGWLLDCLHPALSAPAECQRTLRQLAQVLQEDGAQDLGQKACEAWGCAVGLGVLSLRRKRKWAMEGGLPCAMDGVDAAPKAPLVADGPKLQAAVVRAIGFSLDGVALSVQGAAETVRPAAVAWAYGWGRQFGEQHDVLPAEGQAVLAQACSQLKVCCLWQAALLRAKLEWKAFKQLLGELKRSVLLASQCVSAQHVLCMVTGTHDLGNASIQLVEVLNSLLFPAFFNVVPAEQQYQSSAAEGQAQQAAKTPAALNRLGKAIKQRADSERKLFPALISAMSDFEHSAVSLAQQCLALRGSAPGMSGAQAVTQVYGSWFRRAVNRDFKLNASALQQLLNSRQAEADEADS